MSDSGRGITFHAAVSSGGREQALLLLHGFMGSSADWQPAAGSLGKLFSCIAVDLPGHGKTEVPGTDSHYSMPAAAAALVKYIDSLGIGRFSVAGYSMGGRLALYLASVYGDRIAGAVIISASPGLRSENERTARINADKRLAERLRNDFSRGFLEEWYAQPLFSGVQERSGYGKMIDRRLQNDPNGLALSLEYMGTGVQPPLWDSLGAIACPLLFLAGGGDEKYVRLSREAAALCGRADVRIVPDCGHAVLFEESGVCADSISVFISKKGTL